MREYGSEEIRNVAVVGHGGSGKTPLVDSLAFVSGASSSGGAKSLGPSIGMRATLQALGRFGLARAPRVA